MTWREWASTAADVGTALTGVAALVGVYGLWAWRSQKRRDRQSDAALRIYELVNRGAGALALLSAPVIVGPLSNEKENRNLASRLRRLYEERTKAVEKDLLALDEAVSLGALVLDRVSTYSLDGLIAVRHMVRLNFVMCAMSIEEGRFDPGGPEAQGAWGPEVQERIRKIREEIRHALRPLAQYHWSPVMSMIFGAQGRRLARWLTERRRYRREALAGARASNSTDAEST